MEETRSRTLTPEQRAYYKKFHPDLNRNKLQRAGKVSIDNRNLEHLSTVTAFYVYDVEAEFEPPKAWSWSREGPLTREMEKRRREWFVREVEKIWRACGGTGRGGHYSDDAGQHTGPLLDLLVELLDQFGAPAAQRSRRTLYRTIIGKR
jgi:hypothetical protein